MPAGKSWAPSQEEGREPVQPLGGRGARARAAPAGQAGFTLVEVLVTTAVLGVLGSALAWTAVNLAGLGDVLGERAARESQAIAAMAQITLGSALYPGAAAAEAVSAPAPDGTATELRYTVDGEEYRYSVGSPGTLTLTVGGTSSQVLAGGVEAFQVQRYTLGGRSVLRVELTVALRRARGSLSWTLVSEVVPRNL